MEKEYWTPIMLLAGFIACLVIIYLMVPVNL